MSATKRGVSKSQGKSVPGTDRVRMVETSAATIRFTGGGASYSSESDCSDDLVINRECDTRRNMAQPGVHRLANNRVNDDTPTKGRLPIKRGGSHARVKFKNDEGTNPFGSCSDEEENKGSIARVKHKNSDRTNPFGSCSDEEEDKGSIACVKHKNSDRTNPFGSCSDEEEVKGSIARVKHKNSDRTNPFGSCSDDEEHEGSSACVKHKHSGGTNPFGSYSDKEEHKGFVAHMKHKDGDRTNPFGSESGEEAPLEANSVASSHPHISLLSDNDGWTETGRIDKGNAALPGNDSHADHVNRLSLRFNPFNTLCQEDDGDEEDLSHRHRVKSRGDQGLSQMDRTDHKTKVCQPVPTAGQPIMVTPRVKHPSTNCTTSSDSWTDQFELTPQNSGVDNANSNTELDLMEEHFSQPEDHCRMSNRKELETAIKNCKQLIVEVEPNSEDAKNLIHKLVQLRLKLADSMEEKKADDKHVKIVVGHHFEEKQSRSSKHYCEKCNCVIWGMLQRWYRCTACGFCTHAKCLSLITRKCAAVKVSENPTYVMSVCCERGLSSQNYRCSECRAKIGFQRGFPEARQCDYSGDYYCDMCHWNDTGVIPARILHNWDFEPRKVCRASKQFLRLMFSRPVLHIQQINPMLFSYVEELNDTKRLREEIIIMKRYFLSCKAALDSKLLLQLRPRQHFVETSDMYSLKDLVDVATDILLPELAKIHASIAQHIKTDCQVCQLKGYICELCDLREVLFPFDSIAIVCPQCSAVLHRHCYMQSGRHCPNCERLSRTVS